MSGQERDMERLIKEAECPYHSIHAASGPCRFQVLAATALAPVVAAIRDEAKAEALRGVRQALRDERQRDPSTYNVWSRVGQVVDRIGGDQ